MGKVAKRARPSSSGASSVFPGSSWDDGAAGSSNKTKKVLGCAEMFFSFVLVGLVCLVPFSRYNNKGESSFELEKGYYSLRVKELMDAGNLEKAFSYLEKAVAADEIADGHAIFVDLLDQVDKKEVAAAHLASAMMLHSEGNFDAAMARYRNAYFVDPDSSAARYVAASLEGNPYSPERTPREYVALLFDTEAEIRAKDEGSALGLFEHVHGLTLQDGIHDALTDLISVLSDGEVSHWWDVMILGCGRSGRLGMELRPLANVILGVDVSSAAVSGSQACGVFDSVLQMDALSALEGAPPASFDVIAAAGILPYFGDLNKFAVIAEIARTLRPDGLALLSVDILADDEDVDFKLNSTGRWSHRRSFLEELVSSQNLRLVAESIVAPTARLGRSTPVLNGRSAVGIKAGVFLVQKQANKRNR
jgi:predicted TPR repeat methyltransferase